MPSPSFRRRPGLRLLRGAVLSAFAATGSAALPAIAAAPSQAADLARYDIPAGPLSAALNRFGQQARVMVSYTPDQAAGRQSPGVQGRYDPAGALRSLLAGTGLQAVPREGGGYALAPAPARAPGQPVTLEPVSVVGTTETADGPVQGYVARRSATATKTDTPILETPQSISVVTRDALQTQGTLNVANALRYTAGVSPAAYSNGDGTAYDAFIMRGFQVSSSGLLLDGMRLRYNVLDAPTEVYGLERVEVLRGPSSVLYGQSGPSGVINMVSKRPSTESRHEIEATVGSDDRRQIATDHTGALNEDGTLSYRLTGLFRESDGFADYTRDDRTFIAPALKWQPSAATSLTLLASYQDNKSDYYAGLPYNGTIQHNPLGTPGRDTNLGDSNYNYWNSESKALGYIFEHQVNDSLQFRQSLRYSEAELRYGYLFPVAVLPDNRTVLRQAIQRHDRSDTLTADTNVTGRWQGLGGEHTTLVGLDYGRNHYSTLNLRDAAPPTDLFDPVNGLPGLPPPLAPRNDAYLRAEQVGVYAQQQSKFADRWVVTLGGRQDWAESRSDNHLAASRSRQRDDAFSGRIGLTYLAPYGIAPYLSYAESFDPVTGTDFDGNPFRPTEGKQYEVGVKWQPEGSNTLVTLAAYHLTQQNVTTPDPDQVNHPGGLVQTGEIRSKGVELEAATDLTRNLRMRAALTFNNAEVTKSNLPGEVGRHAPDAPARMASLWLDYRFDDATVLRGLSVGGGLRYTSGTYDAANTVKTAGHTIYDATLGYEINRWQFALNVLNVFNKKYYSSCFANSCWWGQPRTAMLTARYVW